MNEQDTQLENEDFKKILGIGPAIEKRLHEAEIHTYAQLSAKEPDELAVILEDMAGLSAERIADQDWTGQARQLAAENLSDEENASKESISNEEEEIEDRQHYAVFTVELLLDQENAVRRTRVMHIQTREENAWAGWDQDRLVRFFVEKEGLKIPQPTRVFARAGSFASQTEPVDEALVGNLNLSDLQPVSQGESGNMVWHNKPFELQLTLDLREVDKSAHRHIGYTVQVFAKRLGESTEREIGTASGKITPAGTVILKVGELQLPRGVYRLEALATLSSGKPGQTGPMAMVESSPVEVF
jgi:hypothetical protein